MGGTELMSVDSGDSHTDRQERLSSLKREKMKQIRSTIAERERTIEKLMRRSQALNEEQKEQLADEIKSTYSGMSGSKAKGQPGGSKFYAVLQDVNSEVERGSFTAYSLRSGTSQAPSETDLLEQKMPGHEFSPDPKLQELEEVLETEDQRKREQLNKDMRM